MWQFQLNELDTAVHKFSIFMADASLTFRQVIENWQSNDAFIDAFAERLSGSDFSAYRWELPALGARSVDDPFECVLVEYPGLNRPAKRSDFQEYFQDQSTVVRFGNLSGDTELIAPCPINSETNYSHLASFLRTGSRDQVRSLWRLVGEAMAEKIGPQPVWLSTAGMGIPWLHVRIANKPKYYAHAPYTSRLP